MQFLAVLVLAAAALGQTPEPTRCMPPTGVLARDCTRTVGQTCDFSCPQGATLFGSTTGTCTEGPTEEATGDETVEWIYAGEVPQCKRQCADLTDLLLEKHANLETPACSGATIDHQTQCTFSCPSGLSFNGAHDADEEITLNCVDGDWSAMLPMCEDTNHCHEDYHGCNPATSECVDLEAPATGFTCECKEGFGGDPNPNGTPDGEGCQKFSMKTTDVETLIFRGPYCDDCDMKFRFGGEGNAREYSITDMNNHLDQLDEDLETAAAEINGRIDEEVETIDSSLTALDDKLENEVDTALSTLRSDLGGVDSTLTAALATEASNRNSADQELANEISSAKASIVQLANNVATNYALKTWVEAKGYDTVSSVNTKDTNLRNSLQTWTNNNFYTRSASDGRYYTKSQADGRYWTRAQADGRYYTKGTSDSRYYTKSASDSRYWTRGAADGRYYTKAASDGRYWTRAQSDSRYAGKQLKFWSGWCTYHGRRYCNWLYYCLNYQDRDTMGSMKYRGGDYMRFYTSGYYRLNYYGIQHTGNWGWRHIRYLINGSQRTFLHRYHHTWQNVEADLTYWFSNNNYFRLYLYVCGSSYYNWHAGDWGGHGSRMQVTYLGSF